MSEGAPMIGGDRPPLPARAGSASLHAPGQRQGWRLADPVLALVPILVHRLAEHLSLRWCPASWSEVALHLVPPLGMAGAALCLWRTSPPLPGEAVRVPGHRALSVAAGLLLGMLAAAANLLSMLAGSAEKVALFCSIHLGAAALVVHVAILAPIAEEIAFRGLLYRHLRRAMIPAAAVGTSALIFAVMHGSLAQATWALILGVVAAIAYEVTRSLLTPMLIHGLFNAVPIGVAVVRSRPGDTGPLWLILMIIGLVFTFAARRAGQRAAENSR